MKILIVEDDPLIADFLVKNLANEGYEVDHEIDGHAALSLILNNHFDLLILDLMLPSIEGEAILRELRNQENHIPVIILSALQNVETKIKLLNVGADDYLHKPFSFVELNARVQSVLRRASHSKEAKEIALGDLKIIPKMRAAYCGDHLIQLSLKEYDLLSYLMLHPNQVISRNTLIEKVWDYNMTIASNTVDSHISLLRKKVNEHLDSPSIKTIRGVGYILSV